MINTIKTPYFITPESDFEIGKAATLPKDKELNTSHLKRVLKHHRKEIARLQHQLFAEDKQSLLLIFQAMDAAGKDSTIRSVMKGVNPAGCHVSSFKKPSAEELDHEFLWRSAIRLPERGRIGIFNRSYYEETLVVRVHPEYLQYQRLPDLPTDLVESNLENLWKQRFESINEHEKHLTRNGTVVIKFWLNVSKEEQKKRLLSRLNIPKKNWKFAAGDLKERALWSDYMYAYQEMLNATSTENAPWYAIPADNKLFMRVEVAKTIVETLRAMNPKYPSVDQDELHKFDEMRALLNEDKG